MRVCWHTNFFHDAWVIQLNVNHLKPWDSVCIVSQVNFTTMKDPSTGFARLPERYHYGCFQLVPATGNPWKPTRINESVVGTSEIFEEADWFTKLPTGSFERKNDLDSNSQFEESNSKKNTKTCVSIEEFESPNSDEFGSSQTFPLPSPSQLNWVLNLGRITQDFGQRHLGDVYAAVRVIWCRVDFCGVCFPPSEKPRLGKKGELRKIKHDKTQLWCFVLLNCMWLFVVFFRLEGLISLEWVLGPIFASNFNECRTRNSMCSTIPFKWISISNVLVFTSQLLLLVDTAHYSPPRNGEVSCWRGSNKTDW